MKLSSILLIPLLFLPASSQADLRLSHLMRQLDNPEEASRAATELIQRGEASVPILLRAARSDDSLERRGWAIVCLTRINAPGTRKALASIAADGQSPDLVKRWAAAGEVELAPDVETLLEVRSRYAGFRELNRPVTKRLQALVGGTRLNNADVTARMLDIIRTDPSLQQPLTPILLTASPRTLGRTMLRAKHQQTRYLAASYLATRAGKSATDAELVKSELLDLYRFRSGARPPWLGGPLYLPGLAWGKKDGTRLVGELLTWMVWCDRKGRRQDVQKINVNLSSVGLLGQINMAWPRDRDQVVGWLKSYAQVAGRPAVTRILRSQNVLDDARYARALR